MKKKRKLASLLLVLAMSLVLAIPCFAASPESTASSVPTISLDGKKPGDKVVVGDFTIEIIDAEQYNAIAKTRSGFIIQNQHYTSAASGSFVWNCGSDPSIMFTTDCTDSKTDVTSVFDALPIARISNSAISGTVNYWTITYTNASGSNIQYQTVNFFFEPEDSDLAMDVYFSAREFS